MTAEKGLCLKDEFIELRVRLCRGDVLVGQMFAVLRKRQSKICFITCMV